MPADEPKSNPLKEMNEGENGLDGRFTHARAIGEELARIRRSRPGIPVPRSTALFIAAGLAGLFAYAVNQNHENHVRKFSGQNNTQNRAGGRTAEDDYMLSHNRAFTDPDYTPSAPSEAPVENAYTPNYVLPEETSAQPDAPAYDEGTYMTQMDEFIKTFVPEMNEDDRAVLAIALSHELVKNTLAEPSYVYKSLDEKGSLITIARAPAAVDGEVSSLICTSNGTKITSLGVSSATPDKNNITTYTFNNLSLMPGNGDASEMQVKMNGVMAGMTDCRIAMRALKQNFPDLAEFSSPSI